MSEQARTPATDEQRAAGLAHARTEIDSIDDKIHALLMRRAEVVEQVAATKRLADGSLRGGAYRPAREANILRRLYSQNRPPLPFPMVFSLWRQMIGAFTAMQTPVQVSVQAQQEQDDRADLIGLTREHFGAGANITARTSFGRVADDIRLDPGTIGVASARFEGEREGAWWTACMSSAKDAPRVIAALPFYGDQIAGYCICRAPLEPSGNDETLIAVSFDEVISRSGAASTLKRSGIDGTPLSMSGSTALLRIAGFHADTSAEMHREIASAFSISPTRIAVVGAYATPIRESKV